MIRSTTPRRHSAPERVPLPAETRAALKSISDDLRNMPRDCIGDRAELLFWLNRLARRLDAERDRTAPGPSYGLGAANGSQNSGMGRVSPTQSAQRLHASATARERAEAVFKPETKASSMPPKPRTVVSRKGKKVRVEVRRRAAVQIEMELL